NATRGNYVPLIDHPVGDNRSTVLFQFLERARMCCRALAPKKACGSEKESASAYLYLKLCGTRSSQPVDKTPVVLEAPGAESPGHKEHVVGTEGLRYGIRFNAKTPIIHDVLSGRADTPFEIIHDLHRLQARYRVVEPDEVQRRHPVKYNKCGFHKAYLPLFCVRSNGLRLS